MAAGLGVDVVSVPRVGRLLSEQPAAREEIFTSGELSYCDGKRRRVDHLAARFAAKEAVLKAIGTGVGPRMRWTDVEVVNDVLGRPSAVLHGEAAAAARRRGLGPIALSMSHGAGVAMAIAVATVGAGGGDA